MPKTKQKRVWTPEQRQAAAQRMRAMHEKRNAAVAGIFPVGRPPEVQAVIDTMDPARKAKLAMVQQGVWHDNGRADGKQAQEALARHEAEKGAVSSAVIPEAFNQAAPHRDPQRVGSREVSLIVRTDGTMVSQYGPCVCGRSKREWHAICLKSG